MIVALIKALQHGLNVTAQASQMDYLQLEQ
jgi:hypothetical protein